MTLGLGRLQQSFRKLCLEADHNDRPQERLRGRILIAPLPGEQHLMGAVFDAEMMWREGWDTHCEFPEDNAALIKLVKRQWFDVVDLSLSLAFNREDWMPRMAQTITDVRRASLNPALVVVVRGRVFFDHDGPLARADPQRGRRRREHRGGAGRAVVSALGVPRLKPHQRQAAQARQHGQVLFAALHHQPAHGVRPMRR